MMLIVCWVTNLKTSAFTGRARSSRLLPSMVFDFPAPMLAALQLAYRTPPRAYHAWSHVEDVEQWYQEVIKGPGWKKPREVFIAILFHDAVYVAGRKDNEEKSAALALELIGKHLANQQVDTARVANLILLTARHGALTPSDVDPEAALFLDCDMAILGAAPEVFDRYDAMIREEYSAVPSVLYSLGRRRFLSRLLGSPRIFLSDYFHARLDAAARANVGRVLGDA